MSPTFPQFVVSIIQCEIEKRVRGEIVLSVGVSPERP